MKNKILSIVFVLYISLFSLAGIIIEDEKISIPERRTLRSFPKYEMNSEYVNKLEQYLLEQFPFRNSFRSLKAKFNYNVLNTLENNHIYLKDNYIFKSEYPTNKDSIANFIKVISKNKENLSKDNKVYMMIIPDKNYFLDDDYFLQIDYDYLYKELEKLDVNLIDIRDIMKLSDYYETDIHWRQEKIVKVVKKMSEVMDFSYIKQDYVEKVYNNFYGGYYGESAISRRAEKLVYLMNDELNHVSVKYFENEKLDKVYNESKLTGMDSYDVYLDGASSFIEITNGKSDSLKELVIFRDSFGSSIAPLLVPYYHKITLIDTRYITSAYYLDLIDFSNQDVLFLYNTVVVNSSFALKS